MALLLRPDGTRDTILPANGRTFTPEEIYDHLKCKVLEVIRLADGRDMWIDEHGRFGGRPPAEPAGDLPPAEGRRHAVGHRDGPRPHLQPPGVRAGRLMVRIMWNHDDTKAVLYCPVSEWAFGPLFSDDNDRTASENAHSFVDSLRRDPRLMSENELEKAHADWVVGQGGEAWIRVTWP